VKLLTLARDLRRRKSRERNRLFVAEGIRAVEELLRSSLTVEGMLVGPQLLESDRGSGLLQSALGRSVATEHVTAIELASAADTESPQGVLAVGVIPARSLDDVPQDQRFEVLVLDAVQDPGNVGTILRTSAALGVSATVALPGTVDLWNAKVVRSGMGAQFHHLCLPATWGELDEFRLRRGAEVWGADTEGPPLDQRGRPDRLLLVVGNEGNGLTPDSRERAGHRVGLRLTSDVESLNVAVAAGILLYELRK